MAGFIHFVMRLDKDTFSVYKWSYISILFLPLTRDSSYQSSNQSICIAYPSSDQKNHIQPTNQFKLHPRAITKNNNNNTLSSHPNLPKKKLFLTNTHSHISPRPQAMSHSTPPLASTPSSSGTCKYDTHAVKDSTVYENSTTTSTSFFYEDDDEEDDDDDEDDEEEPFIILQATAIKITSFPPTAGAVAKISMQGKGRGSGIATTTSQKFGKTPVRATGVPAFLATPGDALPVFSSERAKRAARSVR